MIAYITIPEPCHENWQAMTPNEQGRHCAQCCKTVIDFSGWEQQEILYYLKAHQSDHVCGRFRNDQLNTPIPAPETFVLQLSQTPLSIIKKIAAIFLFVFGLMSASCNTPQTSAVQHKPDSLKQTTTPADTIDKMIMGGMGVTVPAHTDSTIAEAIFVPPIIVKEPIEEEAGEPIDYGHTGGAPVVQEVYTTGVTADTAAAPFNIPIDSTK